MNAEPAAAGSAGRLGARIRQLRLEHVPPLTQRELADRAGLSTSLVEKLEQGSRLGTRVSTLRFVAAALDADLAALLALPGTPVEPGGPAGRSATGSGPARPPKPVTESARTVIPFFPHAHEATLVPPGLTAPLMKNPTAELLDFLRENWHLLVRADNLLGPQQALPGVLQQVALIERISSETTGANRRAFFQMGARYAESAAWLYEDLGRARQSAQLLTRALEWATVVEDDSMIAWVSFRQSQQATSRRNVDKTISLAQSVQASGTASPWVRAAALQQEARALALTGNETEFNRRLDEAHKWAAPPEPRGDARGGHGAFCTPAYLEAQRGWCWLKLGRPDRAVVSYTEALVNLPDVYQRDRGHHLAGLAAAYAAEPGGAELARETARQAEDIARLSGSVRILHALADVKRTLPR